MIDMQRLARLERLAYEAETATRAMWQEVWALHITERDKNHKEAQEANAVLNGFAGLHVPTAATLAIAGVVMAALLEHAKSDPKVWQKVFHHHAEFDEVTRFLNQLTALMNKAGGPVGEPK